MTRVPPVRPDRVAHDRAAHDATARSAEPRDGDPRDGVPHDKERHDEAPVAAVEVSIGGWDRLGERAGAVRHAVFVIEQRIPAALEWDGADADCVHALAVDGQGRAVGTGRLLPDAHIGRMAVLRAARGRGVGGALLERLVDAARARGDRAVELSAQRTAERFYRHHGFEAQGDAYLEAGIEHVRMRRELY